MMMVMTSRTVTLNNCEGFGGGSHRKQHFLLPFSNKHNTARAQKILTHKSINKRQCRTRRVAQISKTVRLQSFSSSPCLHYKLRYSSSKSNGTHNERGEAPHSSQRFRTAPSEITWRYHRSSSRTTSRRGARFAHHLPSPLSPATRSAQIVVEHNLQRVGLGSAPAS